MKTAASEIPSEEIPSIGTGCASTKVAAKRSANTPARTSGSGFDATNSPDGEREHGEAREGHRDDDGQKPRRLARNETTLRLHPTRCALGRANGAQAHGYDLTVRRATRPTLKVAQKSGQKGGDNCNVRELYSAIRLEMFFLLLGSAPRKARARRSFSRPSGRLSERP